MTEQLWTSERLIERHKEWRKTMLTNGLAAACVTNDVIAEYEAERTQLKARIAELETWNYALIERCATAELAARGRWEDVTPGQYGQWGIFDNGVITVINEDDTDFINVLLPSDWRLQRRIQEAS